VFSYQYVYQSICSSVIKLIKSSNKCCYFEEKTTLKLSLVGLTPVMKKGEFNLAKTSRVSEILILTTFIPFASKLTKKKLPQDHSDVQTSSNAILTKTLPRREWKCVWVRVSACECVCECVWYIYLLMDRLLISQDKVGSLGKDFSTPPLLTTRFNHSANEVCQKQVENNIFVCSTFSISPVKRPFQEIIIRTERK